MTPVQYTKRFEQFSSIEITEGEGFDYKLVSKLRRGLNNLNIRCVLSLKVLE